MSFEQFEQGDNTPEQKPVDPFTRELHTGERVLASVDKLMDGKSVDHIQQSTEVFLSHVEMNRSTYEKMLGELDPAEKAAFECVLARDLEDFYYKHYIALYRRLGAQKDSGEQG